MVSIPACHAGDRGSIPRRGDFLIFSNCNRDLRRVNVRKRMPFIFIIALSTYEPDSYVV